MPDSEIARIGPNRLQEASEGPKAIFAYRLLTGIGTIVITAMVTALFAYVVDVNKNVVDLRISSAVAAGRADLLVDRINAHAVRLDRLDGRQDKLDDKLTKIQLNNPH